MEKWLSNHPTSRCAGDLALRRPPVGTPTSNQERLDAASLISATRLGARGLLRILARTGRYALPLDEIMAAVPVLFLSNFRSSCRDCLNSYPFDTADLIVSMKAFVSCLFNAIIMTAVSK